MRKIVNDICKNTKLIVLLFVIVVALVAASIFVRQLMTITCCTEPVSPIPTLDASVMDGMMQPMTQETLTETLSNLDIEPAAGQTVPEADNMATENVVAPVLYVLENGSVLPASDDITAGTSAVLESEVVIADDAPRWMRNASKGHIYDMSKPMIAIVIDDVGVVNDRSARSVHELPKAVTLSFLPYGDHTQTLVKEAIEVGHDIMIHLPMEPQKSKNGKMIYPGDDALYVNLSLVEIKRLTVKNINTLKDVAVGVNNHMGSLFTEYGVGMNVVMAEVNREELMFLDSVTSGKTVVESVMKKYPSTPFIKRDRFIDHFQAEDKVLSYLGKLEKTAKVKGFAIGIGHPHTVTTDTLLKWIPTLEAKGIQLVPISAVLKKGIK